MRKKLLLELSRLRGRLSCKGRWGEPERGKLTEEEVAQSEESLLSFSGDAVYSILMLTSGDNEASCGTVKRDPLTFDAEGGEGREGVKVGDC